MTWFKPARPQKPAPDFSTISSRIFATANGDVFLGKKKISPDLRAALRDQARALQSSQLWDILDASITNEAANLALIQSTDFSQVRFAKALHHWNHFLRNVVHTLAKE